MGDQSYDAKNNLFYWINKSINTQYIDCTIPVVYFRLILNKLQIQC